MASLLLRSTPAIGVALLLLAGQLPADGQQVADPSFRPPIDKPTFAPGKGPLVLIDEAHNNFHTATGRYLAFAELLRRDGYRVEGSTTPFTVEALRRAGVMVIANARKLTDAPAFTEQEVAALRSWIEQGGALLLITDHPPMVEPASQIGTALGIRHRNGAARDPAAGTSRLIFRRADGTLRDHEITRGIDQIATFTGSSFELVAPGDPILVFGPGVRSFAGPDDPNPVPIEGHLQGAVLQVGKGRVAVFGEAAMFSAQVSGPDRRPMGMNADVATQNARFLVNVMRWLARR